MTERRLGERSSLVYQVRGKPELDSEKARFRLAKLTEVLCPPHPKDTLGNRVKNYRCPVAAVTEARLGVKFETRISVVETVDSWELFFAKLDVAEMRDAITVVATELYNRGRAVQQRDAFVGEARRILEEENLAYEIDDLGGVHPLIDSAFSVAMDTAVSGLGDPRYAASLACLSKVDDHLLKDPQDLIEAIRAVFDACENTFKMIYGVPRLDKRTAKDKIGRDQDRLCAGHPTLLSASAKTLESFAAWIDAAHNYRHAQGVEQPNQPSAEIGILMVSQGLGYVRWLASLDQKKLAEQAS